MDSFFNLQEGETVIQEIKPLQNLKWYFFFSFEGLGITAVVWGIVYIYLIFQLADVLAEFLAFSFWIYIVIGIIVGFIFNLVLSLLKYGKQYYWITNKRVIYKRGIIGYRITSIPLERISDVIISRTFVERIFGFGSLHIQSLAGQASGAHTLGSEGVLLAVPEPESIQELVFKLVKRKRVEEKLTM